MLRRRGHCTHLLHCLPTTCSCLSHLQTWQEATTYHCLHAVCHAHASLRFVSAMAFSIVPFLMCHCSATCGRMQCCCHVCTRLAQAACCPALSWLLPCTACPPFSSCPSGLAAAPCHVPLPHPVAADLFYSERKKPDVPLLLLCGGGGESGEHFLEEHCTCTCCTCGHHCVSACSATAATPPSPPTLLLRCWERWRSLSRYCHVPPASL